jgi:hypothetical protein
VSEFRRKEERLKRKEIFGFPFLLPTCFLCDKKLCRLLER